MIPALSSWHDFPQLWSIHWEHEMKSTFSSPRSECFTTATERKPGHTAPLHLHWIGKQSPEKKPTPYVHSCHSCVLGTVCHPTETVLTWISKWRQTSAFETKQFKTCLMLGLQGTDRVLYVFAILMTPQTRVPCPTPRANKRWLKDMVLVAHVVLCR